MPTDPFEMGLVHLPFRREMAQFPGLIADVEPGDTKRSRAVFAHIGNIYLVLQHHHAAEDELLWPMLRVRVPVGDQDVVRMAEQHEGIAAAIGAVEAIGPAWAAAADTGRGRELIAAVNEVFDRVKPHLADEEEHVVPMIAEHLTDTEWQKLLDRGAAFLKPRNVVFALAFARIVMTDASADDQRRFLAGVPLPPRILIRLFGGRAYTVYRRRTQPRLAAG